MKDTQRKSVAIVGARGYSGLELSRLLLRHPQVELSGCFATDQNFSLAAYLPEPAAEKIPTWSLENFSEHIRGLHTLFLATPAEVSLELAPQAIASGVNVIDLSGAFRLRQGSAAERIANYKTWYSMAHTEPELLDKAIYGLAPLARLQPSKDAQLIANPGCYATAISLALIPLLRGGLIDTSSIVIDAKSGTTGAGRKASESLLFTEVEGECLPYKVGKHQHWPEIVETVKAHSGKNVSPFLSTHLLNVRRGIIAGIYARVNSPSIGKTDAETEARVTETMRETYAKYDLIRFAALGTSKGDTLLQLKKVVGTARAHISYRAVGEQLYVFSTIDNLLKGAASQAVENLNLLLGLPAEFSLSQTEGIL